MEQSQEIERDLERFYREYIDLFNREDAQRCVDSFARPYVALSGSRGVNLVPNEASYAGDFGRMIEALKGRGWARSDIVAMETWALDPNLGMIVAHVARVKADGSNLEDVRACYMVRRENGQWKIATISEIKPPFLGPGHLPR
jgi:ketosteroid isomerase-like protein